MYNPSHFRETRPAVLRAFIARHPLGTLIAQGPDGLTVELAPMQLIGQDAAPGRLRGHLARTNPLWRALPPGAPVLTLFRGAVHYVSPSWYPAKREHGRVVPTWNYAVVQARGTIHFVEDPQWLGALVEALTDEHEHARAAPWHVGDAPADYVAGHAARDRRLRDRAQLHRGQVQGEPEPLGRGPRRRARGPAGRGRAGRRYRGIVSRRPGMSGRCERTGVFPEY